MIKVHLGDLTKFEGVDYICNAANGIGPMGRGIAGAIKRAGGEEIQRDAYRVCKSQDPQVGDVYTTVAGTLPYKAIIHLVTMKVPGGPTSLEVVVNCLRSLIEYCKNNNIDKVALPALSTGVGGLDKEQVAKIFKAILGTAPSIEFNVVDVDTEFINYMKEVVGL